MRRVVITGLGAVTPVGIGIEAFRKALRNGVCGAGPITRFDSKKFKTHQAFELKNFTPPHGTQFLAPFIQYALTAAAEAAGTSQFDSTSVDPYRVGIVVSSSKGGLHTFHALRERLERNPSAILGARVYSNCVPNFAAQWIARKWKIQGPSKCYVTACATGTTSIIEAARMVQEGTVDYAFAGASDASLVPFLAAGYEQMKVLSPDGMFPFDRRRNGFLLGEGAGVVFLETLESARARRAKIYAEIAGFAYGHDCYSATAFDPKADALSRTLQNSCPRARISPEEIDYLNLHGTGTKECDLYETDQIKRAFGKKAGSISASSTKSMTGHMLGASGAVEVIACCLAMEEGFVPPTVNLEKPDPKCDLDYTPNRAREKKISLAVTHSLAFGGHIAVIVLRKV